MFAIRADLFFTQIDFLQGIDWAFAQNIYKMEPFSIGLAADLF